MDARNKTARAALAHQIDQRAEGAAVITQVGKTWPSTTWSEFAGRVESGAAGLMQAGLGTGDLVVIMLSATSVASETIAAVRAAGAVPLVLGADHTGDALVHALAGAPVRLVIVDDESFVSALGAINLDGAELLAVAADGSGWDRLVAAGAARLGVEPTAVSAAAEAPEEGAALALDAEAGSLVRILRGSTDSLEATDRVLVVGSAGDPQVLAALDAHLNSGATLAWIETVDGIESALAGVKPTLLHLDAVSSLAIEDVLLTAQVNGSVWHRSPASVLEALRTMDAGSDVPRMVRRRTAPAERLGAWFGADLARISVSGEPSSLLVNLAELLSISVEAHADVDMVLLDAEKLMELAGPLAAEVAETTAAARLAAAPVEMGDPTLLPRRERRDVDAAFKLSAKQRVRAVAGAGVPDVSGAIVPSLPLFGGESALDRLLSQQTSSAGNGPVVPSQADRRGAGAGADSGSQQATRSSARKPVLRSVS